MVEPEPHTVPYGGAEATINAMAGVARQASAPKVRVNTIARRGRSSPMSSTVWRETKDSPNSVDGIAALGEPEEIVGTALYLASGDASSYTSGQVVRVDSGTW